MATITDPTAAEAPEEITEERIQLLPKGVRVTVSKGKGADAYICTGLLVGLMHSADGATLRVLGEDRLERRIPLPARVTVR